MKNAYIKHNNIKALCCQYQPVECIVLDFDGTFIREHILICWVLFLLLKSGLNIKQKCLFFFKSFSRGAVSTIFSSQSLTCKWAVKLAYKTFKGIDISTIDEMLNCKKGKKGFVVDLNPSLTELLGELLRNCASRPEIRIYSQGSFNYAIRKFMERKDVKDRLSKIGISPDSIIIDANELETDDNNKFTGILSGRIQTKFNRVKNINENTIFIGDGKDEAALKKTGLQAVKFINWKKLPANKPGNKSPG